MVFTPSDIQPISGLFVLLLFIMIFINNTIKIPKLILPLFILAIYSVFYSPFITQVSTPFLSNIRSLYGYIIGPITFIVFYKISINKYRNIIFIATAVVFFGTCMELSTKMIGLGTLYDTFIDGIFRPRGASIESINYRGSSSIFPEPSFVAITLTFHVFLYIITGKNKKSKKYYFLAIFPILATLSGSILSILLSVIISLVLVKTISISSKKRTKKNYINFIYALILIIFSFSITTNILSKTRIGYIAKNIISNPTIILEDPSIFDRVFSMYFPFIILGNNIIGSGTGSYSPSSVDYFINIYKDKDKVVDIASKKKKYLNKNRLMSVIGNYVYDFGIFGVIGLFIFIVSSVVRVVKKKDNKQLAILLMIIILWFQAIPVPHPLPWITLSQLVKNS